MTQTTYAASHLLNETLKGHQKLGRIIRDVIPLPYCPQEIKSGLPSELVFLIVFDEPIQKEVKE